VHAGLLQTAFFAQLVFVTGFFLLAAARTRRLDRTGADVDPRDAVSRDEHRRDAPARSRFLGRAALAGEAPAEYETLVRLDEERARLTRGIEALRAAHAEEEQSFRARRRDVMLELHEHRRILSQLSDEKPQLQERVERLRAEVEHLEHRRSSLTDEIDASIRTSTALRDRAVLAKREIATLRLDRERVERRIRSNGQRLRDLAQRGDVLRAETAELSALLDLLQQLADQPTTLTFLSDGSLREDATGRRRAEGQRGQRVERSLVAGPDLPAPIVASDAGRLATD